MPYFNLPNFTALSTVNKIHPSDCWLGPADAKPEREPTSAVWSELQSGVENSAFADPHHVIRSDESIRFTVKRQQSVNIAL